MVRFRSLLDPHEVEALAERAGLVDAPAGMPGNSGSHPIPFDPQPLVPPGATPTEGLAVATPDAGTGGFDRVPSAGFEPVPMAGIRKTRRSGAQRSLSGSYRVAGRLPTGALPAAPDVPADGPLSAALGALLDWVEACTGVRNVFVADDEGLALLSRDVADDLIAFSAALRRTVRLAASSGASAVLDLGPRGRLHVLWWNAPPGPVAVGAVSDDAIQPAVIDAMRRTLDAISAHAGASA